MARNITFGFRNLNGRAYKVRIERTRRGRFAGPFAAANLRSFVVKTMNEHGRMAEDIAKSPGHSPRLTGALVDSIKWETAKRRGFDKFVVGNLTVGVPYGRRQEYEHATRRLYLHRALQAVTPRLTRALNDRGALEAVILGHRTDAFGRFRGTS